MSTNLTVEMDDTENSTTAYHSCSRYLRSFRQLLPVNWKREIRELTFLAVPVCLSSLMTYLINFVSTVFCGHLGRQELDGVALATSMINVAGIAIGFGLASACDTLISQTYGARNLKRIGVIVQRAILIMLLACCPCWALLINTESILRLVKQSPEVARLSQMYVKIFLPALPASFMYIIEAKYLQNQGIIWPQVISGAVVNVLNVLINYIFLFVLDLGVPGSAAANTISEYCLAISLFAYIKWKGLHKQTWGGWSRECLQEWGSFISLAVPSMLMLCAEWWTYEIGGFLSGLISEVELGAQSVVYGLANIALMFPLGFGVAGSVRVGIAIGARRTQEGKTSARMAVACAVAVSVCLAIVFASAKDVIAYVFSNDEAIVQRVAQVMVIYAPFQIFDGTSNSASSIVKGLGKQKIGAVCTLLGYYGVGFPIGVSLMFAAKMGIMGLWTGLLICVVIQSIFLIILLIKLNWEKATEEALLRAGVLSGQTETDAVEQSQIPEPFGADVDLLTEGRGEVRVSTTGPVLSCRALLLRRGLAIFVSLAVLAIGIIINTLSSR